MDSFFRYWHAGKRLAAVLTLMALMACSTVPNSSANFSPVTPKAGFGAVYVGRPFGFHTSIFALPVELDGKPLASLAPNQYTRVDLAPGRYRLAVPESAWTRAIAGVPHPVDLTVEAGKAYYLLPTRWAGDPHYTVTMVGTMAIPQQTAIAHSSFSVQAVTPTAAPPVDFSNLTYTEPQR